MSIENGEELEDVQLQDVRELKRGDLIRNHGSTQAYVVDVAGHGVAIGVRTVLITNASEWVVVREKAARRKTLLEMAADTGGDVGALVGKQVELVVPRRQIIPHHTDCGGVWVKGDVTHIDGYGSVDVFVCGKCKVQTLQPESPELDQLFEEARGEKKKA